MKFYNMAVSYGADGGRVEPIESAKGKWTTRDNAEQAAQDAVEMAMLARDLLIRSGEISLREISEHPLIIKTKAIIERYEGGKLCE